ncbi:carbohydrate ABC transporter permease [Halomicroarcula sp. GCM10025709]|uniref:carbohydrate ABC transporter permease n=1 Tax=Haloarcula TaxID=2237 RepID=UPI0024C27795|nr:sugar ABC transporter permease [Halomicroarcula sp. YJ-61-S]
MSSGMLTEVSRRIGEADLATLFSEQRRRSIVAWLVLVPTIAVLLLYRTIPLLWTVLLSFQEMSWTGETSFAGLQNYQRLLTDDVFVTALVNNVLFLLTIPVGIALALGIALLLNQQFVGSDGFRSLFFVPYILMMVGIAVIWNYIFKTSGGVANHVLLQLGLIESNISWLGDGTWAKVSVFVVHIWKSIGLYLVIILAGLQTIPQQVYEVARIDGANRRQRFRYITLPLLKPTMGVCILVGMILSFKLFDLIRVLTGGGPADATEILITYLYRQAFTNGNFGYAAVLTVVLFLLMLSLIAVGRFVQRESYR